VNGQYGKESWDEEHLYFDGDSYIQALETAIRSSRETIELETYIYDSDEVGALIADALIDAAERGVLVRVMVDGVGSAGWIWGVGREFEGTSVQTKVYHQLPWERLFSRRKRLGFRIFSLKRRLNNRNHRKMVIIDGTYAMVGGMNISADHSRKWRGNSAWRDTSVKVRGRAVKDLQFAFERTWMGTRQRMHRWLTKEERSGEAFSPLVRLNITRRMRLRHFRQLKEKIAKATTRVWITNAYFVPHRSILLALSEAAERGVDVRILGPLRSDIFFIPYVSSAFHLGLLKAGARVYQYTPSVLHAKTMIIDDWAVCGSSNLNYRSLYHDLEVDVVLSGEKARVSLAQQFLTDLQVSSEVTMERWKGRPWWEKCLGNILLLFRYWM
jgi:cardiolipin synthase A/B